MGPGLLTVEGTQYTFLLEGMWKSEIPPRPGMSVDVHFNQSGIPECVYAVSEGQIAKEQAQKAFSGMLQQSETVRGGLKSRFGIGTIIAESLMLLCLFLLPNLQMGNAYSQRRVNGWDALGLNPNTMLTDSHGFLSLLAILCLLAPLAVPLLKQTWARWLNAAPFAFSLLAVVTLSIQIHSIGNAASGQIGAVFGAEAAHTMSREMNGMFSMSIGAYGVLLCSIYLLTRALRKSA